MVTKMSRSPMRTKFTVSVFVCLFPIVNFAQHYYSLNYLAGRMVPHSPYTKDLAAEISGVQLDAQWLLRQDPSKKIQISGRDPNHRTIGFTMLYMDMGLPVTGYQLGAGLSLGTQYSKTDDVAVIFQFNEGITWLSEKYNPKSSPINYAIGSNFNLLAQIKVGLMFNLVPNFSLSLGGDLTHASNANWAKPNVGLNAIHAHAGVVYYPDEVNGNSKQSHYIAKKRYFAFPYSFGMKIGIREHTLEFPQSMTVFIFDAQYRIQKSAGHIWDFGIDLFSDPNYKLDKYGNFTGAQDMDILEAGIKCGHQFVFGRVGLRTDLGLYILRPIGSEKRGFYNCVGLDYRLNQNWVARCRAKASLNIADYMEWGLSCLW